MVVRKMPHGVQTGAGNLSCLSGTRPHLVVLEGAKSVFLGGESRVQSAPITVRSAPGLLGLLSYLTRPDSDLQSREISPLTRPTPPRGRVGRKDDFLSLEPLDQKASATGIQISHRLDRVMGVS